MRYSLLTLRNWERRVSYLRKSVIVRDRHARERSRRTSSTRKSRRKKRREIRVSPCIRITSRLDNSRKTRIRRTRRRAELRIQKRGRRRTRWRALSSSLKCKKSLKTMLQERSKGRKIKKKELKADSIEIFNLPNITTNRLSGSSYENRGCLS